MNENSTHVSPWQEPEAFLRERFNGARDEVQRSIKDITNLTQRNPEKALLWALGTGYILRIVPIGQIFGAIIRVLFALLKPAALIYGGIKIWQQAQAVVADKPAAPESNQG